MTFTKKELIEQDLPAFVTENTEEADIIKSFVGFTTYFSGFNKNRENMYSDEEKNTSIAYRVINQNMLRYFDNIRALKKFMQLNTDDAIDEIETIYADELNDKSINDFFSVENYSLFLSQSGIDSYNRIIGGYATDDRTKVKGINEYINLYNQKENEKIAILKPLYKQILAEATTKSFLPEEFECDSALIESIAIFKEKISSTLVEIRKIFDNIEKYDAKGIYLKTESLNNISNKVFSNFYSIKDALIEQYDLNYNGKSNKETKKYAEDRSKYFKNLKSISADKVSTATGVNLLKLYRNNIMEIFEEIEYAENNMQELLNISYPEDRKLAKDKKNVRVIKAYLDSIKTLQELMKPLLGSQEESEKDVVFYGEYSKCWDEIDAVTPLYNKVRNYLTKKPYSIEKIKLNFDNSTLLAGWDLNKEEDNTAILLKKDDIFYLGIMDKKHNKIFRNIEVTDDEKCYQKMEYRQIPGANKMLPKAFFSQSGIKTFDPPQEIIDIHKNGTFKKGDSFKLCDCHKIIDFYKGVINEYRDWSTFNFNFLATNEYKDISQFYHEIDNQGYRISFKPISEEKINEYVEKGWLYLFKIWNKDFSKNSTGTPNLHTLYWKMLFDPRNLADVVYKLDGGAELFYRKASIQPKDIVSHPANTAIENKNPLNNKRESIFSYDIIKDRRFTVDKFQFHVPMTLNFKASGEGNIKLQAREHIKHSDNMHVIGIDRGERNLLYICVIDGKGNIVEQHSLNEIVNEYKDRQYKTDYHALLDAKEKERDKARKEWEEIKNIKELKEGYISQVIHKVCELMIKYHAIVALEDLNSGFKNSRKKVEKQVYQKFEKNLIEKLNYLVDKHAEVNEPAGLLNALQLTDKFKGFNELYGQSGFLFYVPAWNTSNIDPCTGFTNLFRASDLKYSSIENSIEFWKKFDNIAYDTEKDMFTFQFDYNNFNRRAEGSQSVWKVYTYGDRIETFRNKEINQQWDSREINLTNSFKKLFIDYNIYFEDEEIKERIINCTEKDFHERLLHLFKLTLQLRNSKTGTMIDYMTSPVMSNDGTFFDSRNGISSLPLDADANGAFNIARKGLWIINKLQNTKDEDLQKVKLTLTNKEWLRYAQESIKNGRFNSHNNA